MPRAALISGALRLKLPRRAEHWSLECRYMATVEPESIEQTVAAVIDEARAFVDGCVADLWRDGSLPAENLR